MDRLPVEVVERIIQLASEEVEGWEETEDRPTVSKYAIVCRQWLEPARRLLYRDVNLWHAAQAMLFYNVVCSGRPDLAQLVRQLCTRDVFNGWEGLRGIRALLDALPKLDDLALFSDHIRTLAAHPHWHKLSRLRISEEGDLQVGTEVGSQLPRNLKELDLHASRSLVSQNRTWSGIKLPHLECFRLVRTSTSVCDAGMDTSPPDGNLLPHMPKLRRFEAVQFCRGPASEELLIKLVKEVASKIEGLTIIDHQVDGNLITPMLLPYLKKLQTLEYTGPVQMFSSRAFRQMFPPSLHFFDIEWQGPIEFGVHLLEALGDKKFLPSLQKCPRLVYDPEGPRSQPVPHDKARALLKLALRAHESLIDRGISMAGTELRLTDSHHSRSKTLPCLPFPLPWRCSLADPAKQFLHEILHDEGPPCTMASVLPE